MAEKGGVEQAGGNTFLRSPSGGVVVEVASGKTFDVVVDGTKEFSVSASGVTQESGNIAATGTITGTSASASALAVGRLGATTPALVVDASAATSVTGLKIASAATGTATAVSATGSATDEHLTIDAKGAGVLTLQGTATGGLKVGTNATDRVAIKGIYMSPANVAVTVPSITDPDCARVQVDVSSAFSIQPAVGDFVIAAPQEALPTNCRLGGAWVYQTDGIEITFSSEGGNVTGAAKNFKFFIVDVT